MFSFQSLIFPSFTSFLFGHFPLAGSSYVWGFFFDQGNHLLTRPCYTLLLSSSIRLFRTHLLFLFFRNLNIYEWLILMVLNVRLSLLSFICVGLSSFVIYVYIGITSSWLHISMRNAVLQDGKLYKIYETKLCKPKKMYITTKNCWQIW